MPRRQRSRSSSVRAAGTGALVWLFAFLAFPATVRSAGIEYLGHSCFVLTSAEGTRLIVDPFATDEWPGLPFPVVHAEHVLVSHPHWDHDAWRSVRGKAKLLEAPKLEAGGFRVRAIAGRHARVGGDAIGFRNTIHVIEVDGLRICHLGDNGPLSDNPDLAAAIGPVDILMLPVDAEKRVLDYEQASLWVGALAPRVVIPMHYLIPGVALDNITGIGIIDEWLSRLPEGVAWETREIRTDVTKGNLPEKRTVWVFRLKGEDPFHVAAKRVVAGAERDKAEVALSRGDLAGAMESLLAVAAADPADADTRQKIGFLYMNDNRPDRALEFFAAGAKAAGADAVASAGAARAKSLCWLGSGMALDLLGRRDEAIAAYKEVIALGVNDDQQVDNARRWIERRYETD